MDNLFMSKPPPNFDAYAPEFCFCGNRTVESHEFWFCSTKCARLDALRALDDPECHYRNNARKACVQAGVSELLPRRMISTGQLRPGPTEHRVVVNPPARLPLPKNVTHKRNFGGFPAPPQATGSVIKKRGAETFVAETNDRENWDIPLRGPSRLQHRDERADEEEFQQLSKNDFALQEPVPARTLRRVPQSTDNLRMNIRKSVAALFIRSRRENTSGNPERVFGHPVNGIVPPMRKESLPSNRQPKGPPSTTKSKALRRSRSFAVGCSAENRDTVMHIINEMRQEMASSFDPRSLFDNDDD